MMRAELGFIERFDETGKSFEPDDEAYIFLFGEGDETIRRSIHVEAPNAKSIALKIIAALAPEQDK